jgi:prepilin-type N-terminal cleavage/methylation domain-containing protein
MRKLSNGFTLVELLAVIAVLALLLLIGIPSITGVLKMATQSTLKVNAEGVLKQIENKLLENRKYDVTTIDETNVSNFNLSNENYDDLQVGIIDEKPYIIIVGKNRWAGLKVCGVVKIQLLSM